MTSENANDESVQDDTTEADTFEDGMLEEGQYEEGAAKDLITSEPSRSEQLLAEAKEQGRFRGQFRLRGLMVLTFAVAILFALPRWMGVPHMWSVWVLVRFTFVLSALAFLFTPCFAFGIVAIYPWRLSRRRLPRFLMMLLVAALTFFVFAGSNLLLHGIRPSTLEDLVFFIAGSAVFWLPQMAAMWFVWQFMLKDDRPRRNPSQARRKPSRTKTADASLSSDSARSERPDEPPSDSPHD